jgi:hypothetical protein
MLNHAAQTLRMVGLRDVFSSEDGASPAQWIGHIMPAIVAILLVTWMIRVFVL